ncbi:hypothetical protein D3C80_1076900 [compost metagenome]
MAITQQHFQQSASQLLLAFDGLVGVGVGAQVDRRAHIARLAQLLFEHGGGVGLGNQLGFEVQPRRQVPIGMAGPRIAVDAAMLAAAIRVDRTIKRQVGRVVAGDDALGGFDAYFGALGQGHFLVPTVILGHRAIRGEAVMGIARGATTPHRSLRIEHEKPRILFLYTVHGACVRFQYRWAPAENAGAGAFTRLTSSTSD